jgi:tRNA(Ile)-lysidine synthetase-like protein
LIASDDPDQIRQNPLAALLAVPPDARLDLRARQPGDRFQPHGMGGRSQKLSDTLINAHIPAQWRDKIPLLTVNDQIAWFVFPTDEGPRSRIAEPFSKDHGLRIVSCWQKE